MVGAVGAVRVGVHGGRASGEADAWISRCSASHRDGVRLDQRQVVVDHDVHLGAQRVADPAQPHRADLPARPASRRGSARPGRPGPGRRRPSAGGRSPGPRPAARSRIATVISRPTIGSAIGQPSAAPPAPSSTASEVKPSVRACSPSATSAAEPISPADPDPVAGHPLVAEEADHAGGGDPAERLHVLGVDQPLDRLVAGERGRGGDGQHDDDPGQVLGPAVAVGEAAGRPPAGPARRRSPAAPRSGRRRSCAACRPAAPPSRRTPRSPPGRRR